MLKDYQAEIQLSFTMPVLADSVLNAESRGAAEASRLVQKAFQKQGINKFGVTVRTVKDDTDRCYAMKGTQMVEVDWGTLVPVKANDRTLRYRELVDKYEPNSESLTTMEEAIEKGNPFRFLFIEKGDTTWFAYFDHLYQARAHYARDYDPSNYDLRQVIDLDTGRQVPFRMEYRLAIEENHPLEQSFDKGVEANGGAS